MAIIAYVGNSSFARYCQGPCSGVHYLSGCPLQLNPCAFFVECFERGVVDQNASYILNGFCNGFDIVDESFDSSYFCSNYDSILKPDVRIQMDNTVSQDLSLDKLSLIDSLPTCVHSLGH